MATRTMSPLMMSSGFIYPKMIASEKLGYSEFTVKMRLILSLSTHSSAPTILQKKIGYHSISMWTNVVENSRGGG